MIIERGKGKVGVVGTGMVGCSFAYSLMQSGLASEMVLIDKDEKRAAGAGDGPQSRPALHASDAHPSGRL